jgi:hypothetical protein
MSRVWGLNYPLQFDRNLMILQNFDGLMPPKDMRFTQ